MSTVSQRLLALVLTAFAICVPLHGQRKSNILTFEEIERANLHASTAYDLVEQLRPRWLSKHEPARFAGPSPSSPMSPGAAAPTSAERRESVGIRVWMNEYNVGDADYLKTIPAERVLEMRWYSANEAATRFGSTGRFGSTDDAAIQVVLKRWSPQ